MKKMTKSDLRLRLPDWILDELALAAKQAGIEAKPTAAAAYQVLEEWVRERQDKRKREESAA